MEALRNVSMQLSHRLEHLRNSLMVHNQLTGTMSQQLKKQRGAAKGRGTRAQCIDEDHSLSLMEQLFKDQETCDTTIHIRSETFRAHKWVLITSSQYFKSMFNSGFRETNESEVRLDGLSPVAFKRTLKFMYTGKVCLKKSMMKDLLECAAYLSLTNLLAFCEKYLVETITVHNCLDMLKLSDTYTLQILGDKSEMFFKGHFTAVSKLDQFLELNKEFLCAVLRSQNIWNIEEIDIVTAVLRWLYHSADRTKDVADLMQCVRLGLLTLEQITEVEFDPLVYKTDVCTDMIQTAYRFHWEPNMRPYFSRQRAFQPRHRANVIMMVGGMRVQERPSIMPSVQDEVFEDGTVLRRTKFQRTLAFIKVKGTKSSEMTLERSRTDAHLCNSPCSYAAFGATVYNNFIYVCGGITDHQHIPKSAQKTTHFYDPIDNMWIQVSSMNYARFHLGLVTMGSRLLAIGGEDQDGIGLAAVECYSIQKDDWENIAALPEAVSRMAACVLNGVPYISGGLDQLNNTSNKLYKYDEEENNWVELSSMYYRRRLHCMHAIGGKLYVLGGGGSHPEYYCPATDQWTRAERVRDVGQNEHQLPFSSFSLGRTIYVIKPMWFGQVNKFCIDSLKWEREFTYADLDEEHYEYEEICGQFLVKLKIPHMQLKAYRQRRQAHANHVNHANYNNHSDSDSDSSIGDI